MKKKHTKHSRKTTARSRIISTAYSNLSVNTAAISDEPNYYGKDERKRTKNQLEAELAASQEMQRYLTSKLDASNNSFETAKKEWRDQRQNRELDMRIKVAEACGHLIDSLARMVGGPGF